MIMRSLNDIHKKVISLRKHIITLTYRIRIRGLKGYLAEFSLIASNFPLYIAEIQNKTASTIVLGCFYLALVFW